MLDTLPAEATLHAPTDSWWVSFACGPKVGNSTLNRDRAALLAFRTWAAQENCVPEFKTKRRTEEPHKSEILTRSRLMPCVAFF